MNQNDLAEIFIWQQYSIQQNPDGDWFLILAYSHEEKKQIAYDVLSKVKMRLEVHVNPVSKIYNFSLIFKYNSEKEIEYSQDTGETSIDYPFLVNLNNGNVKFITTGVWTETPGEYVYRQPLVPIDCMMMPN